MPYSNPERYLSNKLNTMRKSEQNDYFATSAHKHDMRFCQIYLHWGSRNQPAT